MKKYTREQKLKLDKKIYLTEEVDELLKEQKKKQKISKAKIACNLIIEKYGTRGMDK